MLTNTFITKLKKFYIKVESFILITLLIALVAIVFMEVVVRLFDNPTTWSVGVAQLIFMWVIFLGANHALRNNSHIGIDILTNLLPEKIQNYIEIVSRLAVVCFLITLIFYGFEMTFANTGRLITGTSIGYFTVTLAVPVGALLMIITALKQMISLIKNHKSLVNSK